MRSVWKSIILREHNIISQNKSPDPEDFLVASVMSNNSQLLINLEKLGFADDRKLTFLTEGRNDFKKKPCSVNSIMSIPWVGKNLYEVREAKNSFFLIQNQLGSRRIDLMKIEQEMSFREDQILIANKYIGIKFKFTDHYMLFL